MNVADLLKGNGSDKVQWKVLGSHMVSNCPPASTFKGYCLEHQPKAIKIAAFDMDDTLICTSSGTKFGRAPTDWKWRTPTVLRTLKEKVCDEHYVMVIFTNQAAVSVSLALPHSSKSYKNLTRKVDMILSSFQKACGHLQPLFFASSGRPGMATKVRSSVEQHVRTRKPETGMWSALEAYIKRALGDEYSIDMEGSFYVGDAAGRAGDHLADDKGFAANVGVRFYEPEEFFGE